MLTGKTAVVTGGSRGIGKAIALSLAGDGANIAVIYSGNREAAQEVCQDIHWSFGVHAEAFCCNVADFKQTKDVTAQIRDIFGRIDILVNNAGVTKDGLLAMMKEEDYDLVMDVNLKGAFNMIRHMTKPLMKSRGCVINIASVSGLMGNAGQVNYAASKAGLIGLTRSVARELAPKGVRCNAIAPGFIATDMTADQIHNPMLEKIPLGTMGRPEDVAEAALYLTQAGYVTGEVLKVDGGIAM